MPFINYSAKTYLNWKKVNTKPLDKMLSHYMHIEQIYPPSRQGAYKPLHTLKPYMQ